MIVGRSLSLRSVGASVRQANLVFFFWALIATYIDRRADIRHLTISPTPLTILGAALTIFLGFRTNTAYGRWWEARILWGGLVNQSRTLVRQLLTYLPAEEGGGSAPVPPLARELAYCQIALVNAIRTHLRKQDALEAVRPFLSPDAMQSLNGHKNIPNALLSHLGRRLQEAYRSGSLDSIQLAALDDTLTELTNLLGGCERIKNTPLPRQYDTVPQIALYGYSFLLPLGLVESVGWWTPAVSALITFLFIAIDTIGSNIEDPFDNTIHDTPMTALCRTIEINLRQMVGDPADTLPRSLEPIRGVLH